AILIALVLAIATAWLLWRERHALGSFWSAAFWGLRMVAVCLVLWMLLGPMQEIVERSTNPQSIAILADSSESMAIVDPPDPPTSLRWDMLGDASYERSPLTLCDKANVALGVAQHASQRMKNLLEEHRPLRQLKLALEEVE